MTRLETRENDLLFVSKISKNLNYFPDFSSMRFQISVSDIPQVKSTNFSRKTLESCPNCVLKVQNCLLGVNNNFFVDVSECFNSKCQYLSSQVIELVAV